MKIAITAETTVDLPKELLEKYEIKTLPFRVTLGDEEYEDGILTSDQIFAYVAKTGILPKTSAINEEAYKEFFDETLKDCDAMIHFCLSSGISCACQNAINAAKSYNNVYVIDTLSLSTGIACQAIYARQLVQKYDDPEKVVELVEKRKEYVQTSFIVERLDYLYKGGRCSGFQLLGANLLKIRPRIVMKNGKLVNDKKFRGEMGMAVKKYCQDCLNEFSDVDKSLAFITYSSATPEMIKGAREALESVGVRNIYETKAGATITSHCGDHTLGILYYNDGEETLKD